MGDLRQKAWRVSIRPYYTVNGEKVVYTGSIKGPAMPKTVPTEYYSIENPELTAEVWMQIFEDPSFDISKGVYEKWILDIGFQNVKLEMVVPTSIIVEPTK